MKILSAILLVIFPLTAFANCGSAVYSETGLSLNSLDKLETSMDDAIITEKFPGKDGGIYVFQKNVDVLGVTSSRNMGFFKGSKAVAISLSFSDVINAQDFSKKYNLKIKQTNGAGSLFQCGDEYSLFIGKQNNFYMLSYKSISGVDSLLQ